MKKTTSDRPKKKRGWARCLNGRVEEENDWVEPLIRKGASHMETWGMHDRKGQERGLPSGSSLRVLKEMKGGQESQSFGMGKYGALSCRDS